MKPTIQGHSNLTPSQQGFIYLRQGHKSIKDIDKKIFKDECAKILVKSAFEMNSPIADDAQILEFQTQALFNELKKPFDNLTLPELYEAFRLGIRGESGQFFGMCPKTYHQFIKWFFNLPERQKSWVDFLASQDQLKISEKPIADRIEFSKQSAIKAFEHYKLTKEVPLSPSSYYDVINEFIGIDYKGKKTLITDPETRKKIVTECEELHTKMAMGLKKKSEANGHFNEAEKLIEVIIDPKGQKNLERMIKAAFLKQYFNQLIESGKEMEL